MNITRKILSEIPPNAGLVAAVAVPIVAGSAFGVWRQSHRAQEATPAAQAPLGGLVVGAGAGAVVAAVVTSVVTALK